MLEKDHARLSVGTHAIRRVYFKAIETDQQAQAIA